METRRLSLGLAPHLSQLEVVPYLSAHCGRCCQGVIAVGAYTNIGRGNELAGQRARPVVEIQITCRGEPSIRLGIGNSRGRVPGRQGGALFWGIGVARLSVEGDFDIIDFCKNTIKNSWSDASS